MPACCALSSRTCSRTPGSSRADSPSRASSSALSPWTVLPRSTLRQRGRIRSDEGGQAVPGVPTAARCARLRGDGSRPRDGSADRASPRRPRLGASRNLGSGATFWFTVPDWLERRVTGATVTLRVLIVEDSMDDVLLLQRELRRGGYDTSARRVQDAASLAAALADDTWDLVLCDYVVPGLDILEALRVVQASGTRSPVHHRLGSGWRGRGGDGAEGRRPRLRHQGAAQPAGAGDRARAPRGRRPRAAAARPSRRCARARSGTGCWSRASRTTRSACSTPRGRSRAGTAAPSAIFGYAASEIRGSHVGRLFRALDGTQELPTQILEAAASVGTYESEVWCTREDGTALLASMLITAVRDEDGALKGFTLLGRDITEQMRIAEERMQSQKLEVIGRLAGSVAHDFNNLLTIVSGFTELLIQSLDDDETQPHLPGRDHEGGGSGRNAHAAIAGVRAATAAPAPRDRRQRDRRQHGDDAAAADRREHRAEHPARPPRPARSAPTRSRSSRRS